jgi:uncharacterized membrane protein YqiK
MGYDWLIGSVAVVVLVLLGAIIFIMVSVFSRH